MTRNCRTPDALAILTERVAELCSAAGRDDLVHGIFLLEELARATPAAVKSKRKDLQSIIASDDWTVEAGRDIQSYAADVAQAFAQRRHSTVQ